MDIVMTNFMSVLFQWAKAAHIHWLRDGEEYTLWCHGLEHIKLHLAGNGTNAHPAATALAFQKWRI